MQAQKHFQAATFLFFDNKLEEALLAINQSINLKPSCSISFSNRGLIYYHMGKTSQARDDLDMALSINHLNYAAYFNLSSIDCRQQDPASSIQNLVCAISALKLIYGRITKQKSEVLASLQLCSNNYDALVLLILMEVAAENYQQGLNVIIKFERFQEDKIMMRQLKDKLDQLSKRYSYECQEKFYDLLEGQVMQKRLKCSINIKSQLLEEELGPTLRQRLKEFNKYYQLVNSFAGKTKHVPKANQSYLLMDHQTPTNISHFQSVNTQTMIASH